MKYLGIGLIVVFAMFSIGVLAGVGPVYKDRNQEHFALLVPTAAGDIYNIVQKASDSYAIKEVAIECTSGTITASLLIDGTDVGTCNGLAVTSTEQTSVCTSPAGLGVGETLALEATANSSCLNLSLSVLAQRN